ncbi:major tail protein [Gordonia phage Ashertheman]|uniref:Major tail protein n=1 Tax=Gordonia phage Ashertheman TaxID=2301692 RepID=A0A385DU87_9CAUD|nr:major tail protein [Gordonia phage Ashertheman]AXQ62931.1 major tail protein [Gordonia phage Ashertheman]
MANKVWPSVRAKIMRLTRLDECGAPVTGPKSTLVTDGLISVDISAEYEDGTENAPKNGNDKFCFIETMPDEFKYFTLGIAFCGVDPEAWEIITGNPIYEDAAGNAVGIKFGRYSEEIETAFALEVWSDVPGTACGTGGKRYGYHLWPYIGSGRLDELTLNNETAEFTLGNAKTKDGNQWESGGYDVVLDAAATPAPGPLVDPLTPEDHYLPITTQVAPPTATAGAVAYPPV